MSWKPKLFMSHHSADEALAIELAEDLAGLCETFVAHASIRLGVEWPVTLRQNLLAADGGILLYTERALRSPWVQAEAAAMWTNGVRLFPALVGVAPAELPPFLATTQSHGILTRPGRSSLIEAVRRWARRASPRPMTTTELNTLVIDTLGLAFGREWKPDVVVGCGKRGSAFAFMLASRADYTVAVHYLRGRAISAEAVRLLVQEDAPRRRLLVVEWSRDSGRRASRLVEAFHRVYPEMDTRTLSAFTTGRTEGAPDFVVREGPPRPPPWLHGHLA